MLDYPALRALSEILRRGSFEAAAQALSVTPSAISQRIRGLESRYGAALIERGPPLRGTPKGLRLAAHLDQVRLLEQALAGKEGGDMPVVRIAINADSLACWAMPALAACPGLIDLIVDDQDHAQSWLESGLVAAAMTCDSRPVGGCDSLALGAMRYRATASPAFVARYFSSGIDADSLMGAPALSFNSKDGLQDRWVAGLIGRRVALPLHRIPSTQAFADATRLGLGWGMNPEMMVGADIANGGLVDLAPERPLDVPLSWQTARVTASALAPLTAALRHAAKGMLRVIT